MSSITPPTGHPGPSAPLIFAAEYHADPNNRPPADPLPPTALALPPAGHTIEYLVEEEAALQQLLLTAVAAGHSTVARNTNITDNNFQQMILESAEDEITEREQLMLIIQQYASSY